MKLFTAGGVETFLIMGCTVCSVVTVSLCYRFLIGLKMILSYVCTFLLTSESSDEIQHHTT